MAEQALADVGRDDEAVPAEHLRVPLHEVLDEGRDLLDPLPQRRHAELDDVEPVVEVLAEATLQDRPLQILVGGGDDPHVHAHHALAAHAREVAVLQHVQELGLQRRMQVADLVEEDRALVGRLELADLLLVGAGERAPLVTEQLALQQIVGHGRAVHLDEGARASHGEIVDGPGHDDPAEVPHPLALPQRQLLAHGRRRGHGLRARRRRQHRGDRLVDLTGRERRLQQRVGRDHDAPVERAAARTAAERDDRAGIAALGLQPADQPGAVSAVQIEVDHGEAEVALLERGQGLGAGAGQDTRVAATAQEFENLRPRRRRRCDDERTMIVHVVVPSPEVTTDSRARQVRKWCATSCGGGRRAACGRVIAQTRDCRGGVSVGGVRPHSEILLSSVL